MIILLRTPYSVFGTVVHQFLKVLKIHTLNPPAKQGDWKETYPRSHTQIWVDAGDDLCSSRLNPLLTELTARMFPKLSHSTE